MVAEDLSAASAAIQAAPAGYYLATVGELQPGKVYSPDQLQAINDSALAADGGDVMSTEAEGSVSPMASTPNGFTLWNQGNKSGDYIYNSSNWKANLNYCVGFDCTVIDTWNNQMRENVTGGSSTRWTITLNSTRVLGTTSTSFSYDYYCGVDINDASDKLCAGGGASGSASGAMNPGDTINKSFGSSSGNQVFPMVRITAIFKTSQGSSLASTPFRGWDVCNGNSGKNKLCSYAKH